MTKISTVSPQFEPRKYPYLGKLKAVPTIYVWFTAPNTGLAMQYPEDLGYPERMKKICSDYAEASYLPVYGTITLEK